MIINFSTKQIDNPKDWWFQVVYHGMPSQSTFLQMIKDWKFKNIEKAFRKRTLPDTESIMKRNDCISIHVYAPSHHSNLVQEFFSGKTWQKICWTHWMIPSFLGLQSPDCHFWDNGKIKLYGDRAIELIKLLQTNKHRRKDRKGLDWTIKWS